MAEKCQTARKALLTALTTGFVHAALDAGHGFTHFPHASERGAILATGKTKTTLVNRGFARFGSHEIPLAKSFPLGAQGQRVYFNRFSPCLDSATKRPPLFKATKPKTANTLDQT